MKYFLLLVSIAITVCACSNSPHDTVREFIPGTYVREVSNEMSVGRDTLRVSAVSGLSYAIRRNAGYRRIKEGIFLPPEYRTETWTAIYDEQTGVLNEAKRGRTLSFDSRQGLLLVGGSMYRKITE